MPTLPDLGPTRICSANQLTGFYMMRTLVVKGLKRPFEHFLQTFTDGHLFQGKKCPSTGSFLYILAKKGKFYQLKNYQPN